LCDRVLVVDVPEQVQIERTCRRDDNSEELVKQIIAAQTSRERRLAAATEVLDNTGTLEDLQRRVDELHERYLQLASAKRGT
jgi:dephospho-CoA kinase